MAIRGHGRIPRTASAMGSSAHIEPMRSNPDAGGAMRSALARWQADHPLTAQSSVQVRPLSSIVRSLATKSQMAGLGRAGTPDNRWWQGSAQTGHSIGVARRPEPANQRLSGRRQRKRSDNLLDHTIAVLEMHREVEVLLVDQQMLIARHCQISRHRARGTGPQGEAFPCTPSAPSPSLPANVGWCPHGRGPKGLTGK